MPEKKTKFPRFCSLKSLLFLVVILSSCICGAEAQIEIVQKCVKCCKALEKIGEFKNQFRHVECINHGCFARPNASPDCKFSGYGKFLELSYNLLLAYLYNLQNGGKRKEPVLLEEAGIMGI